MSLGRFLEVSLTTPDVAESLAFYEALGFVQAATGEAFRYPYAVVTDGRICLGLHERPEPAAPALAWVLPRLAGEVDRWEALGIDFEAMRVDDASLNSASFFDPAGTLVTLLEARTFSPPALAPGYGSALGYFEEFGVPARELRTAAAFWERIGFVAFEPVPDPFTRIIASGRDLNIGLYDLDLRNAVLTFSDADMPARVAELAEKGFVFSSRLPRGLAGSGAAILHAPEGTELLLLSSPAEPDLSGDTGIFLQETPGN